MATVFSLYTSEPVKSEGRYFTTVFSHDREYLLGNFAPLHKDNYFVDVASLVNLAFYRATATGRENPIGTKLCIAFKV